MKVKAAKEGSIVKNYEYILCYGRNADSKKVVKNILYDVNPYYDNHFNIYMDKSDCTKKKLIDLFNTDDRIRAEFKKYNLCVDMKNIDKLLDISDTFKELIFKTYSDSIYQEMACNITIPKEIDEELSGGKIVFYKDYILTKSSGDKLRQLSPLSETIKIADDYNSTYGRVTIRGDLWKGFYSDMMNVAKEGNINLLNGKKPIRLIKQLMKWVGIANDDIVLDFFSGSATTAHAVMLSNAEDGQSRQFIMVQIPEKCNNITNGGTDEIETLCDLGLKRISNVSAELSNRSVQKKLDDASSRLDTGFRVFYVDTSNMNDIFYNPHQVKKDILDYLADNIKIDRTGEDLLFQVMLELGIELSAQIMRESIDGKEVYSVDGGYLIACFDQNISEDLITKIAHQQPYYAVFRDSCMSSDAVLINFGEIFKTYSPNTKTRVLRCRRISSVLILRHWNIRQTLWRA